MASGRAQTEVDGRGDDELTRRALEILSQLYELPDSDAQSAVSRACAGDSALESECLRLLQADRAAGPIPLDPPVTHLPRAGAGEVVGPYRLIAPLDHGRSGAVWLAVRAGADHVPSMQRFAVKLGSVSGSEAASVDRFRIEVEALHQLNHPGIARVFAAGSEPSREGFRTWIALELIEGTWITRLPPALASAGWRERVVLVRQACDAIAHAHQRGVIHRDLKPANILLAPPPASGTSWIVKIVDFDASRVRPVGAARTLSLGEGIVGTVQYAAPEQLRGERADVYGLGAVLYELLAGRPPIELDGGADPLPKIAAALHQEPAPLVSLRPDVPASLAAVVHKALHKDRERRYQTVAEFAADLDAAIAGLPVRARPPSLVEQARGAWRTRPRLAASIVAGGLMLSIGLAATGVMLGRARDAERRLLAEQRELHGLVSYLTSQSAEVIGDLPGTLAAREVMLRDFAARLAPFVEEVSKDRVDPALARAYARVLRGLADIEQGLGQLRDAHSRRRTVLALLDAASRRAPSDLELAADLSIATVQFGDVEQELRNHAIARALYDRARELDERLHAAAPSDARLADNLVRSYIRRAAWELRDRRHIEALAWIERARLVVDTLERVDPARRLTLQARLETEVLGGEILEESGRIVDAGAVARRTLPAARLYWDRFPASKHALTTASRVYNLAVRTNAATALPPGVLDDVLRLTEALSAAARADPTDAALSVKAGMSLLFTVEALAAGGRADAVVVLLARQAQRAGLEPEQSTWALRRFAECGLHAVRRDVRDARGALELAAEVERELAVIAGRGSTPLHQEAQVLAALLHGLRLGPAAIDQALARFEQVDRVDANPPGLAWMARRLLLVRLSRWQEADAALERARELNGAANAPWLAL